MELIREINDGYRISNPSIVYEKYLKEFINEDREYMISLGLNTKNEVIFREITSIGTLDSGVSNPREVFKKSLIMSCKSLIIAHNHPSGDPEPSNEDTETTKRIKEGAELLGLQLLDHIIIGKDRYFSYKDEEML